MRRLLLLPLLLACEAEPQEAADLAPEPDAVQDMGVADLPPKPDGPSEFEPIGQEPDAAPVDAMVVPDAALAPDLGPDPDDGVLRDAAPDAAPPVEPLYLAFEDLEQDSGGLRLTSITFLPDRPGEFLLTDKDGEVIHMIKEGDAARRLGAFRIEDTHSRDDAGVIDLALDPDWANNRTFYVSLSIARETNVVRRYVFDPDDLAATYATETLVIEVFAEGAPRPWHHVGAIGFTDEGYMWVLHGDKKLPHFAQDPAVPTGKVLRIIPSPGREGGYTVPDDNPYADGSGHPAVWAVGVRSPWTGVYAEGVLYFGDVGRDIWEELNRVDANGLNFGWAGLDMLCEGPCDEPDPELTDPWTGYDHTGSQIFSREDPEVTPSARRSIYVGWQYQPVEEDPYGRRWNGTLTFGDTFRGFVRCADVASDETWHCGHLDLATGWAQAPDGYVYAVTLGNWPIPAEGDPAPARIVRAVPAEPPAPEE